MTLQQYSNSSDRTGSGPGNAVYLLAGGLIGAAMALLFAPKAGSELRGSIADISKRGYDGALDLTSRVKEQAADLYGSVREKGSDPNGVAGEKLLRAEGTVTNAASDAGEQAKNVLNLPDQNRGGTPQGKSTDII